MKVIKVKIKYYKEDLASLKEYLTEAGKKTFEISDTTPTYFGDQIEFFKEMKREYNNLNTLVGKLENVFKLKSRQSVFIEGYLLDYDNDGDPLQSGSDHNYYQAAGRCLQICEDCSMCEECDACTKCDGEKDECWGNYQDDDIEEQERVCINGKGCKNKDIKNKCKYCEVCKGEKAEQKSFAKFSARNWLGRQLIFDKEEAEEHLKSYARGEKRDKTKDND